jgi:hypothetical protein
LVRACCVRQRSNLGGHCFHYKKQEYNPNEPEYNPNEPEDNPNEPEDNPNEPEDNPNEPGPLLYQMLSPVIG